MIVIWVAGAASRRALSYSRLIRIQIHASANGVEGKILTDGRAERPFDAAACRLADVVLLG
jgi:hypothetical protein